MQLIYYGDLLEHHGVKGQRWGIRRYQPYPQGHNGGKEVGEAASKSKKEKQKSRMKKGLAIGTGVAVTGAAIGAGIVKNKKATDSDNSHSNGDAPSSKSKLTADKRKLFERTIKQGKDKPAISPAEKTANDVNKITQESINVARKILDAKENKRPKTNRAAGISDDELRRRINRLQMERTYNSLTTEEKSSGYEKAMLALGIIGSVTAIASTGVGIVSTIKSIK